MSSIDAGTPPEAGDGRPPAPPAQRRGLRDRPLGRVLLLVVVLLGAALVARTCGSHESEISREEAIEIATRAASFTPCREQGCVVVRAFQQGIPTRLVWLVGLAKDLDEGGRPTQVENFLVDARTGEVARR